MNTTYSQHNKAVHFLGKDIIFKYFDELFKVSDLPVVSVGCGTAILEKEIVKKFECNNDYPNCVNTVTNNPEYFYEPTAKYKRDFILVDPLNTKISFVERLVNMRKEALESMYDMKPLYGNLDIKKNDISDGCVMDPDPNLRYKTPAVTINEVSIEYPTIDSIENTVELHIAKMKLEGYVFGPSTVPELISTNQTIIGNNVVLINWSLPNASTYDIESISLLKPQHVICIYDATGSGGGTELQRWLNYCGIDTTDKAKNDTSKYTKYHVVSSTVIYQPDSMCGTFEYTITWLSLNKLEIEHNIPQIFGEKLQRHQPDIFSIFSELSGML